MTVSVKVFKDGRKITSEYAASVFVWTHGTGDVTADATWNAAHNGVKQFAMNAADRMDDAKLSCMLTGTSLDCGNVYVDEDMNLIYAPAEADANDTLHLEDGNLSVSLRVRRACGRIQVRRVEKTCARAKLDNCI